MLGEDQLCSLHSKRQIVNVNAVFYLRCYSIYIYINNLSIRLTNSGIGGTLGGKFLNHMIYADEVMTSY